jgi:hypothetical protein
MAEWIELIKAISPVLVASAWPCVMLIIVLIFRKEIRTSFDLLLKAIPRVNQAELGKLKVTLSPPLDVVQLPKVETIEAEKLLPGEIRNTLLTKAGRAAIYSKQQGIFLTHIFEPSNNGIFTAHIYLIGHEKKAHPGGQGINNNSLSRVQKAEFYLGEMWNDNVFCRLVDGPGAPVGITVSAYSPFLCTCVVTLSNGDQIELYRYIDFEMEWAFSAQSDI